MARTISEKQVQVLKQIRAHTEDPQTRRKLTMLILRGNGLSLGEISAETGCTPVYVCRVIKKYSEDGLAGIVKSNHSCHFANDALSFEQEAHVLEPFRKRMVRGEFVPTAKLIEALREAAPQPLSKDHIYKILHRHGWHNGSFDSN